MKRWSQFFLMILALSIGQNSLAGEPGLPRLQRTSVVNQKIEYWRWRVGPNQKIYPYLRVEAGQLHFLNMAGETIKRVAYLPLSKISVSPNDAYLGFLEPDDPDVNLKSRRFGYHIMKGEGNETYSIPLDIPYDDPIPALYLAKDGGSVLVDGYHGRVKIYSAGGSLVQEIDLFENDVLDYEKPIACAIAEASEILAVVAQKRPMSFDPVTAKYVSGEPYVLCYSFDGKLLLKKPLECATAAEIAISPAGNFIVISQYTPAEQRKTTIIDRAGEIVWEAPLLFRHARFIGDEAGLVLADGKTVVRIDLKRMTSLSWNLIPDGVNRMVVDLVVNEVDQSFVILTAESVFQDGRFEFIASELIQFDQRGEKMWSLEFEQDKFVLPAIFHEKNQWGIGFESNYKIYEE